MNPKTVSKRAGLFSLMWLLGGYIVFVGLESLPIREGWFGVFELVQWLYFALWLGGGLMLSILSLRRGNLMDRVSGLVGLVMSLMLAWPLLQPFAKTWYYSFVPPDPREFGNAMIPSEAPFCCLYVGLDTNETALFNDAFWKFAATNDIRRPSRHYTSYSGPPRATCHNEHASLFVSVRSTQELVADRQTDTTLNSGQVQWTAGIWRNNYWPTNASQITKNGQQILAPVSGVISFAPNETNYSLVDFKRFSASLTAAMQAAFPDRRVETFSYDGDAALRAAGQQ